MTCSRTANPERPREDDARPAAKIVLVVAVADNGVIGRDGDLPWRMPSDLKNFRRVTLGRPIIMGRKTFEAIGKPLDGRRNIVVSRSLPPTSGECEPLIVADLETAMIEGRAAAARAGVDAVMVIGGAEIYQAAFAMADQIHMTRVHLSPHGDTVFPEPDPNVWSRVSVTPLATTALDDATADIWIFEKC